MITDEQAKQNIAANVSRLRGSRTRYELAKIVNTPPINLTRIERGDHMPSAGLLARLADALGVLVDDLLKSPQKKSRKAS